LGKYVKIFSEIMGLKMNKSTFLGQMRDTGSPEPLGFFLSVVESQ
jgi:hypothetical protein